MQEVPMRRIAAAIGIALLVSSAMAKTKSAKEPRAGQYCSKGAVGPTIQDSKGTTLECKTDKKGKTHFLCQLPVTSASPRPESPEGLGSPTP